MLALLNSAVLTAFGSYAFYRLSRDAAKAMLQAEDFESYFGHEDFARAVSELIGISIPFHRGDYAQETGERAIVIRLARRLQAGETVKTAADFEAVGYQFGLLQRLN